jgi:hypothetical protein
MDMLNKDFTPSAPMPLGDLFLLSDRIRMQRELVARGDYQLLGKVKVVGFERAQGASAADRRTTSGENSIDFGLNGPVLAVSRDGQDIVATQAMKNLLPLIPQPGWMPDSRFRAQRPPMVRQNLSERACGWYPREKEFYVFCPVSQISLVPYDSKTSAFDPSYAGIRCSASRADGTQMAMLFHSRTREIFFLGGRAEWMPIRRVGQIGTPTGFLI